MIRYCVVCYDQVLIRKYLDGREGGPKTEKPPCIGKHGRIEDSWPPNRNCHCDWCIFCSEQCREIARARRAAYARRLDRRDNIYDPPQCVVCGCTFYSRRRFDARICSSACRQKLYRRRKRAVTDSEDVPAWVPIQYP
jgi:hypothetical protein